MPSCARGFETLAGVCPWICTAQTASVKLIGGTCAAANRQHGNCRRTLHCLRPARGPHTDSTGTPHLGPHAADQQVAGAGLVRDVAALLRDAQPIVPPGLVVELQPTALLQQYKLPTAGRGEGCSADLYFGLGREPCRQRSPSFDIGSFSDVDIFQNQAFLSCGSFGEVASPHQTPEWNVVGFQNKSRNQLLSIPGSPSDTLTILTPPTLSPPRLAVWAL